MPKPTKPASLVPVCPDPKCVYHEPPAVLHETSPSQLTCPQCLTTYDKSLVDKLVAKGWHLANILHQRALQKSAQAAAAAAIAKTVADAAAAEAANTTAALVK